MKKRRNEGVDPKLWEAARAVSTRLNEQEIHHALIGGLAVSHYGFERATRDVDFLVAPEAMEILTGRPTTLGFTEKEGNVKIDYMVTDAWEDFLEDAIEQAEESESGVPVIPIGALVYLKLRANRRKDQLDIIELIREGIPVGKVRGYLAKIDDPDLIPSFDLHVREADEP
jgi:hypothetical protein